MRRCDSLCSSSATASRPCCPDYRAQCREDKLAPPSQEDEDSQDSEDKEVKDMDTVEEEEEQGSCLGHCGSRSSGSCW